MAGRAGTAVLEDLPPFTDADTAPGLQTPAQRRADRNATIASMRRNDRATRQRYEPGGDLFEPEEEPPAPSPGPTAPRPSTTPTRATGRARRTARTSGRGLARLAGGKRPLSVGGFLGGMVLYAMGLQLVRNGPGGLSTWFAAKFWNATPAPSLGGLGGTGVAGAGGAGASTALPGTAPGTVLGPGVLGGGIGGPTQVYPSPSQVPPGFGPT